MSLEFFKEGQVEKYVVIIRFDKPPTASKIIGIKSALERASDNQAKLLSSSADTTQVCFVMVTHLTAAGIKETLLGGSRFAETTCIDDKDSVFAAAIMKNASAYGAEFYKNACWLFDK